MQPLNVSHLALALTFTLYFPPVSLTAQESGTSSPMSEDLGAIAEPGTRITSPINDGTPSPPAPEKKPITVDVLNSKSRIVHVVEAPEMAGLPAPEGNIKVTIQRVKDPGLPDPPPPLPPLPPDDPAVQARLAEFRQNFRPTELAFLSATVYNHNRTYFRCFPNGAAKREICGWSNLDFNHLTGFATFQSKGTDGEIRKFGLMMGIGNEDTIRRAESLARQDREYKVPPIPKLPDLASSGPTFVITEGDTSDRETMEFIEGLHRLYQEEGTRMEAAYHARMKAYVERKAFLLANSPKPKDVTIRCWKRESGKKTTATAQPEKR